MSTPLNPLPPQEPQPQLSAEITSAYQDTVAANTSGENPPWTGWDVLLLASIFFVGLFLFTMSAEALVGVFHLFGYNSSQLLHDHKEIERFSYDLRIILPVELLSYLVLLISMIWLMRKRTHGQQGFFEGVHWRWPHNMWPIFLFTGAVLQVAVQRISTLLPVPSKLPIEHFFQTPTQVLFMGATSVLVAPFIEEIFFRGFLYPALTRRLGIAAGVVLTSLGFMLMHGPQLDFSWAPMLILLVVGLVLTIVRARTKSLASSVLIHMSYNATLFLLFFIETEGFRHFERIQ